MQQGCLSQDIFFKEKLLNNQYELARVSNYVATASTADTYCQSFVR